MKRSTRFVMIVPIVAIVFLLFIKAPARWDAMHIAGLALLIPSAILLTTARLQLGNAFSLAPKATTLVTHGLYSRLRNPIYVFAHLVALGLLLYLNQLWLLLLLIPLLIMQIVRARRESQVLEAHFGEAYRQYKARTWF